MHPDGGPPLRMHWFLPTGGDSRDIAPDPSPEAGGAPVRAPSLDYLVQVARAAETVGFDAMLTPCGTGCEDAWLTTAMLVAQTRRIRFLVAFRPGLLSPTLAAQMASTYQRLSGGRLLLNIVTGAEPTELARFGPDVPKAVRYERTAEFIDVIRGAWSDTPIDHDGTHFTVRGATTRQAPDPLPEIYFGGASSDAETVAAGGADVYLAWGEPPAMVAERVERVRALAAARNRNLRFGIRFHVIARPTAAEAWAFAEHLLASVPDEAREAAQADFAATQSEGQRRMASLHGGDAGDLEIHPNVWAGVGLVRGGAGTTIVGSYSEVADRIEEYAGVGFSEFIFSGYPHLEEAWWFGEGVMPILRERGLIEDLRTAGTGELFQFR